MAIFNVATAAELTSAVNKAVNRDQIVLAPGNYGNVSILNKTFSGEVGFRSASLTDRAHFDTLKISGSANLSFTGLDIGRALTSGEPDYTVMASIKNSSAISFYSMNIHGSVDSLPANDGVGISAINVDGFRVSRSSFTELSRGISTQMSAKFVVEESTFEGIRTDGIDSVANLGVVINGNEFTNFSPVTGDHPDAIQFFNTNMPRGSKDITITNNVILQGKGTGTQGIFLSNPGSDGYENVLIKNNLVYSNDQYNGITLHGAKNAQIIDNSVLSSPIDDKLLWIRLDSSENITVRGNITDDIVIVKDVFNLTLDSNVVLKTNTTAHIDFVNLNDPQTFGDLIANNVGVSEQSVSPSPSASAISSALGGILSNRVSLADTATPVHVEDHSRFGSLDSTTDALENYQVGSFVASSHFSFDHFAIA